MISVNDIRVALGEAYSTDPDDSTIQQFIEQRESELKEIIKMELDEAPQQSLLKKWLLNKVCIDVLKWDILGRDSNDAVDYSIGDLKEDKTQAIKLKQGWIQILEEQAENSLKMWFLNNTQYRSVRL